MKYKLKLDIPIWCSVLKALDGAWQICEKSARDMLIVLLAVPSINCIFAKHKFKFAYKTVIVVQHLVYPFFRMEFSPILIFCIICTEGQPEGHHALDQGQGPA